MLVRKCEKPNILYSSNEMYYEEYQYSLVAVFKICLFFYFIKWMNQWKAQREKLHIVLKTTVVFLGQSVFHSALHTEQYSSTKSESQNCHFHIQSAILPSDRNNQEMRWAFSNGSTDTMLKHLYLESRKGYVKHHLIHVGTMFSAHILHNG